MQFRKTLNIGIMLKIVLSEIGMTQGLLAGKRFLIAGVASKLSIAFGIAQALLLWIAAVGTLIFG